MKPCKTFCNQLFLASTLGTVLIAFSLQAQQPSKTDEARKMAADAARELLRAKWNAFAATQKLHALTKPSVLKVAKEAVRDERFLPAPQQRGLALTTTATFVEPTVVPSVNGVLTASLIVDKAHLTIGVDPVFLRCYNGKLVGPTLRAKPGDVLKITIGNRLPPNISGGEHNTLHEYNTTNLHTHGLHVSPSGNSDNVLLEVLPGDKQDYEIQIPKNHPAGTYWYHAHRHGSVAAQVSSGMSGTIVVEGGPGTLDAVPEIAACSERVMVLQQIPYFNTGLPEGIIEETVAADLFGPGAWNKSGRFTTINGVVLPVINMKPGEIERWRLVDSAFRERIDLRLEKVVGDGPANLMFHEIAVDGLPLGKLDTKVGIELWPGYRSDVLVAAPAVPAEYLLVDEAVPPGATMTGEGKNRKYLARIVVAGTPKPMALPASKALSGFRVPSITAAQVTGKQSATYGINVPPLAFQIDGKSFDPKVARILKLNDVEEWTIRSVNNVGPVSHPFHIHVNPFEIFSIKNDAIGVETLSEPIWRDTIIMRPGQTIKFRTRYEDFTGDFVQHCHILDHEDQGMMELIQIVDPAKKVGALDGPGSQKSRPLEKLKGTIGKGRDLEDHLSRPAVLIFSRGLGCSHCMSQLTVFGSKEASFRELGVGVVFVTPDSIADLQARLPAAPFVVLSDPDFATFRKYGSYRDEPMHGVILLDKRGKNLWEIIGPDPFMDVEAVLRRIRKESSRVQGAPPA